MNDAIRSLCKDDTSFPLTDLRHHFLELLKLEPASTLDSENFKCCLDYFCNECSEMLHEDTDFTSIEEIILHDVFLVHYDRCLVYMHGQCAVKSVCAKSLMFTNFLKMQFLIFRSTTKTKVLTERLYADYIIKKLLKLIECRQFYPNECILEPNIGLLVYYTVGCLHNMIEQMPILRHLYRSMCTVSLLKAYVTAFYGLPKAFMKDTFYFLPIRTICLLLLLFLLYEREYKGIQPENSLRYLITILNDSVQSPNIFYSKLYECSTARIFRALCQFAGPDENKLILLKNDAMELVMTVLLNISSDMDSIMKHSLVINDIVATSLELVWLLLFIPESRDYFTNNSKLCSCIESLATDPKLSKGCNFRAQGILWTLNDIHNLKTIKEARAVSVLSSKVVFTCDSSAATLISLYDTALTERDISSTLLSEDMNGSYSQNIMDAYRNATHLVMFISNAFKNTAHCRQAVRSAYYLNMSVHPVCVEPSYSTDGWLGLSLATILHSCVSTSPSDMENFINGLHLSSPSSTINYCCSSSFRIQYIDSNSKNYPHQSTASHSNITPMHQSLEITSSPPSSIDDWKLSDLKYWLQQNDLLIWEDYFSQYSLKMLHNFLILWNAARENFSTTIENELNIPIEEQTKLAKALQLLFNEQNIFIIH